MFGTILITLVFLLAPVGVLWLCRNVPLFGKIGPVLVLYIIGIIIGNVFHPAGMAQVQKVLSNATVPLAIPLMLFGCVFSRSHTRSRLLSLFTGLFSVMLMVVAGYFIFCKGNPDGSRIAGMLTGCYTGGTMNMASLKTMLGVDDTTFVLLNSYDMMVSFSFLTFLLLISIKLFRRILPTYTHSSAASAAAIEREIKKAEANPYKGMLTKKGLADAGVLILVDLAIIGISAGLGLLTGDSWFLTVMILMLTTLGILASFWKPVKKRKYGYEMGMYLIYIFSITVASMADLKEMDFSGGATMVGYLTFIVFASLLLQVILAKLLKIDSDTMVICQVSFICSPPFVPMIAASMKNREVLASGLAVGVVGYAAGNYLGFLIYQLLNLIG